MGKSNLNSPFQRLFALFRSNQKELFALYSYAFFNGLLQLALPLGIESIINLIMGGEVSYSWITLTGLTTFAILSAALLQILQLRIIENLRQKLFAFAAFEYAFRILRIQYQRLINYYLPELVNRFFDIITVQKGIEKVLLDFLVSFSQILFGLLLISLYHSFFVIFSLVVLAILSIVFWLTFSRGLSLSLRVSTHKYETAFWLQELAHNYFSFKLLHYLDLPLQRTDQYVFNYLKTREAYFRVILIQAFFILAFKVLLVLGILVIGGLLVIQQQMNIGQFVAAQAVILILIPAVEKLIATLDSLYSMLTGLEKLGTLTDLPIEAQHGIALHEAAEQHGKAYLRLYEVHFRFPGMNMDLLENINLHVEEGEKVAIVGEAGTGKTTLLYLLASFYSPTEGTILYNDIPIQNLHKGILGKVIGHYFPSDRIFHGSIMENITLGREEIDFALVNDLLTHLGLVQVIRHLPNGFDTILKADGSPLSQSMVQKLLLARAMVSYPRFLLLDNPFVFLDQKDKDRLLDYLCRPDHTWGIIIVSDEKAVLEKMNSIYQIQNRTLIKIA